LIDREKSAADPEGRLFFKKRRNGGIIQRYYERKGYGACSMYSKEGAGSYTASLNPFLKKPVRNSAVSSKRGNWAIMNSDGISAT